MFVDGDASSREISQALKENLRAQSGTEVHSRNGGDGDRTLAWLRPLVFVAHAITAQGLEARRAASFLALLTSWSAGFRMDERIAWHSGQDRTRPADRWADPTRIGEDATRIAAIESPKTVNLHLLRHYPLSIGSGYYGDKLFKANPGRLGIGLWRR